MISYQSLLLSTIILNDTIVLNDSVEAYSIELRMSNAPAAFNLTYCLS